MQEKKTPAARPAESPAAKLPHHLLVEDRSALTATGVTRVVSCDETGATLETQQGTLLVGGEGLIANEAPGEDDLAACRKLGAGLAAMG